MPLMTPQPRMPIFTAVGYRDARGERRRRRAPLEAPRRRPSGSRLQPRLPEARRFLQVEAGLVSGDDAERTRGDPGLGVPIQPPPLALDRPRRRERGERLPRQQPGAPEPRDIVLEE